MRRRNNTHCQFEQPKEIDRFKKRNPARILFAEQVNYSMTINDPIDSSDKNSTPSKNSSNSPFQQLSSEIYTMEETKPPEDTSAQTHKNDSTPEQAKNEQSRVQKTQSIPSKESDVEKEPSPKKSVIIIGDALQYEQKNKGFRKGMRRRYSHKNQADYMTY